ncbi:hypothetical protein [Metabacillus idriensis]|uniref:hypothetical protein n=1 Tax=Metabacillus idriensis TaxID=324768 RepID=UPI003D29E073
MRQESFFNKQPSKKFREIVKEHGEIYTNPKLLKQSLEIYIEKVKEETMTNEFINVELANKIKDVCLVLIDDYEDVDNEKKKYIVATIIYFVTANDDEKDLFSPLGFDDDADILNECLNLIDKKELTVKL